MSAGRLLGERFELVRMLHDGLRGDVWVAEHLALGSQVAVKLCRLPEGPTEAALEEFARPAPPRACATRLVRLLDHGVEGQQPYLVLELLEGEDLGERLRKRGKLSLEQTSTMVTEVCRALTKAHDAGIVHADLRPGHVFFTGRGDEEAVKVLGFGVLDVPPPQAEHTRRLVPMAQRAFLYHPPEQLDGGAIDERADLWALGVLANQAVTGKLPFITETAEALRERLRAGAVPPAASRNRLGLSRAFDDWFVHATQHDPEHRFASAKEMAEELARWPRGACAAQDAERHPASAPGAPRPGHRARSSGKRRARPGCSCGRPGSLAARPGSIHPGRDRATSQHVASRTPRRPRARDRCRAPTTTPSTPPGVMAALPPAGDEAAGARHRLPHRPPASAARLAPSVGVAASAGVAAAGFAAARERVGGQAGRAHHHSPR
ncbi:MAG: serine/threonine-protein kinase [Polyangiaceae bacterium]